MSHSPRHRSHSYSRSRSRSPGGYRDSAQEEGNSTLFAGNLNHDTTEQSLRDFFSHWGKVVDTKIIYDQETGRSRGFGFVKFDDQRDADDAIADADGKFLDGRQLKCNMARNSGGRGGFHPRGAFRGGFRGGPPMRGRGGRFGDFNGYGGRGGYPSGPHRSRRRSHSASPGRYSPGRYSPGSRSRSESPPTKRHRHRSPPRERGAQHGPPGQAGDPGYTPRSAPRMGGPAPNGAPVAAPASAPVARRPAAPGRRPGSPSGSSSYTSGSSYSTTDSEVSTRREKGPPTLPKGVAPAAAVAGPPAPGSFRKELQEAKQRENEQSMRAAALEAEIEQARMAKQETQTKLEETAHKLQRSEESCKQYRKWLAALADYSRAVITGKEAVRAADAEFAQREEELGLFLQEADTFLASQKSRRRKRTDRQPTADAEGAAIKNERDSLALAAAPRAADGTESMQLDPPADEDAANSAAAKFKPGIKFKLAS